MDYQESDTRFKMIDFSIELSCSSIELSIKFLMEEFKIVVLESYEPENGSVSILTEFLTFSDCRGSGA